jgi:heme-degrading monooxygenase HmoA
MTAFNVVRFRVKPGHQKQFIAAHRRANPGMKGFRGGTLVRTGEQTSASSANGRTSSRSSKRARR